MALTVWFNGKELSDSEASLPSSLLFDRINSFGDGAFETMRLEKGVVSLLDRHLTRLRHSLAVLGIDCDDQLLRDNIDLAKKKSLIYDGPQLLKLLISRGSSAQGYAVAQASYHCYLFLLPLERIASNSGRAMICNFRLASQPLLAGIKHCNRLEQVLAKREVEAAAMDEGLLLDQTGNVVEAVSANLFVLQGNCLLTPPIVDCGVSGVMREFLFDSASILSDLRVIETTIDMACLRTAEAVVLSNATQGLRILSSCLFPNGETVHWKDYAVLLALQSAVEDRLSIC